MQLMNNTSSNFLRSSETCLAKQCVFATLKSLFWVIALVKYLVWIPFALSYTILC